MLLALMVAGRLIKGINQAPQEVWMLSGVSSAFVLHLALEVSFPWDAVVPIPLAGGLCYERFLLSQPRIHTNSDGGLWR